MDPLITEIETLTKRAGLEPETLTLLKMAAEAQRAGKMPDLRKLQPTHFHDCTGPTNGVGKITAPQPIADYSSDDLQWMTGTGRYGQG